MAKKKDHGFEVPDGAAHESPVLDPAATDDSGDDQAETAEGQPEAAEEPANVAAPEIVPTTGLPPTPVPSAAELKDVHDAQNAKIAGIRAKRLARRNPVLRRALGIKTGGDLRRMAEQPAS